MLPKQYPHVFLAIRDGSLEKRIEKFTSEDLRPFLPLLMYRTFMSKNNSVEVEESPLLDRIRARLIDCPSGNEILSILRLNYEELQSNFADYKRSSTTKTTAGYTLLPIKQRVVMIGSYLISKGLCGFCLCYFQLSVDNTSTNTESFEPFDVESFQEEVIWIISFLCFFVPQYFKVVNVAAVLMHYCYGRQILKGVVMNHPMFLEHVVERVVSLRQLDDDSLFTKRRLETVTSLLRLDSSLAENFLKNSLHFESRFRICTQILYAKNLVEDRVFVNTLISRLMENNSPLSAFLNKPSNRDLTNRIRKRFNDVLQSNKLADIKDRLILLMCVLSTNNLLNVSIETTHEYVRFLTDQTSDNVRMLKLVLAVILACPNLFPGNQMSTRDDDSESKLTEFFCCIRERTRNGNPKEYASLNQFMLLISIHMNSSNGEELSKLLSEELSFNVGDTLRKHITVKRLFLAHAMQEVDIAQKASNLGVTNNLDQNVSGYLPVHCINQLLIARTFSRNQIGIQDWIKKQICECRVPIHGVMVEMLENFASSCFPTKDDPNFNTAIDEEFFWTIFSTDLFSDDKLLAAKSLSLLYLLAYTRRLDAMPRLDAWISNFPVAYSDRLWAEVPIRYILSAMDARPKDVETIRSNLLHYVSLIMPHMLPTLDASLDLTEEELALPQAPVFKSVPKEMFEEALANISTNPTTFTALVSHLQSAPIHEHYKHYETIICSMVVSLDSSVCSISVATMLAKIWRRLANLIPRKLYEQTLTLWLNTPHAATNGPIQVDNAVLLRETPALMFRVDERIFRSPPHFELLMQILSFYLDATKNYNHVRMIQAQAYSEKYELEEKALLVKPYTGTQHLAVILFLLDVCNGDETKEPLLEEIRDIACAHIHQMFIADAQLALLVHFHTYPVNMIPVVVDKVPSAHVLLHTIPDIINAPNLERRIFIVNLVAELAQKYTIPPAIAVVELIESFLFTLIGALVDEDTILLFLNTCSALKKIMRIGHPHDDVIFALLSKVRKTARARLVIYDSKLDRLESPEHKLISQIDEIIG
ncbi:hypothetical protein M3Y94_00750200 [Aphelenchoides besseyi]|nr:hypothetical protein M3Y94_00750200 [Aphelenchoides besseyi]